MTNPIDLNVNAFKQRLLDVLHDLSEGNEHTYNADKKEMVLNYKAQGEREAVKRRIGLILSTLHREKCAGLIRVRNDQSTTRKTGSTYTYRYLRPAVAAV